MASLKRGVSRGRASWADDDADTEKPHATPQGRPEDDAGQDRGKMGWLRKLGGGSNRGKNNRSPPRAPPLAAPSHSPSPHSPVSPDPKNAAGNASAMSPFALGKQMLHLPQNLMPTFQSAPDPTLVADLEELRKEVKGLQEAFVSLKREHKELRGEMKAREAASKSASLPVDAVDPGKGKQAAKGAGKGQDAGAGVGDMLGGPAQNAQEPVRMLPPPVATADAGDQDDSGVGLFYELFNCCGTSEAKEKAREAASASYAPLGAGGTSDRDIGPLTAPPPLSTQPLPQQQQQQDLRNAAAWTQPVPPLLMGGAARGSNAPAGSAARAQLAEKAPPPREPLMDAERRHNMRSESAGPVLSTSAVSSEASAYTPGFGREGRSPSPVPPQVRPLPLGGASSGSALRRHGHDRDAPFSDEIAATSPWNSPRDVMRPASAGGGATALSSHGDSQSSIARGLSGDSEEAPNFGMRAGSASSQARPHSAAVAGMQPGSRRLPLTKDGTAGSTPWRAPQAGEPLVLPFPDLDDDGGLAPMTVPPPLTPSGSGMAKAASLQNGPPAEGEPLAGKLVFAGSPRL